MRLARRFRLAGSAAVWLLVPCLAGAGEAPRRPAPAGDGGADGREAAQCPEPDRVPLPGVGPAAEPCLRAAAAPPDGPVIRDVRIRIRNVFDPDLPAEDRRVFRLANRLHRVTRPGVIRRQLLFGPGDPYSPRLLAETERLLRDNLYLHDASIRALPRESGTVDVEVDTQDVWSLDLGAAFGRGGGENSTKLKIEDSNLLGSGRGLAIEHVSSVDRSELFARYLDPHLLGSRARMELIFSDNSDGSRQSVRLERPFFALDSRWAGGLQWLADDRVDSLYALGRVVDRFRHRQHLVELRGGWSSGLSGGRAERWSAGVTYRSDRFEALEGAAPDGRLPADRILVYPWVAFESVQDDFLEERNLDRMSRTEDLELGRHYRLQLGLSSRVIGATEDAAVLDAAAGGGVRGRVGDTLTWSARAGGRWGRSGASNLLAGAEARYYRRDFGDHLFFATLNLDVARDLDPENQLLLGGDSGLRGYPLRYQNGEQRALLTLEQRFFTGLYPLQLFHVGAAVFFDAGRTWGGAAQASGDLGLLKDIGVGLRLSSRRSALGSVIHLDLAFPLDGDGSIKTVQWLVESKSTF